MAADGAETPYAYHYRKWHDESDRHFDNMVEYFAGWFNRLGLPLPNQTVLEIGCGWGFSLGGMRKLGVTNVDAFDIDRFAVSMCRRRGFDVTLLDVGQIHDYMAQARDKCDVIVAIDVMEHIPLDAQEQAFRDVLLALKPGGRFICQVPNADSIVAAHMRYVDHTHHTSFTQTSLDAILHNAGFGAAEIRDAEPHDPRPPLRDWSDLKHWLLRRMVRKVARAVFVAELGPYHGYRTPLDKNIVALATRPSI